MNNQQPLTLILGLGNPGPQYHNTRHNIGFMVLDELARRHGLTFRTVRRDKEASTPFSTPLGAVTLSKPQTFMNLSGEVVQRRLSKHNLSLARLLVVHDDLDMPLGKLKFKQGGSAGGQRGVADIIGRVGPDFKRLKIGISRPPEGWQVRNWVLSRFQDEEKVLLAAVVDTATDALELMLATNLPTAMNRYNGTDLRPPSNHQAG